MAIQQVLLRNIVSMPIAGAALFALAKIEPWTARAILLRPTSWCFAGRRRFRRHRPVEHSRRHRNRSLNPSQLQNSPLNRRLSPPQHLWSRSGRIGLFGTYAAMDVSNGSRGSWDTDG